MESDQTWNQVAKFMQQLRGENLSKKSIIQIPGQKNAKNELENIEEIDLALGNNEKSKIVEIIEEYIKTKQKKKIIYDLILVHIK